MKKQPSLVTLMLLASLAAVGAVIFAPALPAIASNFNVSKDIAQWTMTIYLLGYALGQLPYGPLSSSAGRKKGLYLGLSLQIAGALFCAVSLAVGQISMLIIGRLILSIGGASGLVLSFAMIGDCYEGQSARKRISYLTLVFAIAPGLSIALGGFIIKHLTWPFCFYFLALYGLVLLVLTHRLPETLKKSERIPLRFSTILHHYTNKIKHSRLVLASLLMGIATSFNYVFATEAPFLAIDKLNLSTSTYGLLNLIPAAGLLVGCLASAKLAHVVSSLKMIFFGVIGLIGISAIILVLFLSGDFGVWTLFLPTFFIFAFYGLVNANAPAYAFTQGLNRAYASATLQSINLSLVTVAILLLAYLPLKVLSLPLAFFGLAILAIICFGGLSIAVRKTPE
ncbi:MAG: MFS transporter [Chlamydiia bacterium]|nr:MFS transporter [Chlamydiia bacterium]